MYELFDVINRCALKRQYSTFRTAQRKADKLDLEYGAIRYVVRKKI